MEEKERRSDERRDGKGRAAEIAKVQIDRSRGGFNFRASTCLGHSSRLHTATQGCTSPLPGQLHTQEGAQNSTFALVPAAQLRRFRPRVYTAAPELNQHSRSARYGRLDHKRLGCQQGEPCTLRSHK